MENEEIEEKSKRANVRIPLKQWEKMTELGEVLGLDGDSAIIKHFLNLGLQFGGASLAAQRSNDATVRLVGVLEGFAEMAKEIEKKLDEQEAQERLPRARA